MPRDDAAGTHTELTAENDADLLAYMTMAQDDPAIARVAWEVFYRRHVEYMYRLCLRAYSELLGGPPAVADVVAEVFRATYENAHKFDPAGITDAQRLRLRTRAWLGWIARRMVQDLLRGRSRLPLRLLDLDQWQQVAQPERAATRPSPREELARAALLSLTKREQLVIRVTFQWYQADKDHQRLPNDVAADLVKTLQTTPENLRQIRRRALKRIETYICQHLKLPDTGDKCNA